MNRRGFITGLISLVAAPAIVRAGSLMPVKSYLLDDGIALNCMSHPEGFNLALAKSFRETYEIYFANVLNKENIEHIKISSLRGMA
jgi:hypothetical protein